MMRIYLFSKTIILMIVSINMKVSQIFNLFLEKVGLRSSSVPVLCHGCGRMIGIPRDKIQFVELDDSPCCGAHVSPPPQRMDRGKVWDEFGGERIGSNDNPDPDVDADEVVDSLTSMDDIRRR